MFSLYLYDRTQNEKWHLLFFSTSSSLGFASAAAFKKYQLGITSNFVSVSKLKLNKNFILTFKRNKD